MDIVARGSTQGSCFERQIWYILHTPHETSPMAEQARRAGRADPKGDDQPSELALASGKPPGSRSMKSVTGGRTTYGTVYATLDYRTPMTVQSVREGIAVGTVDSLAGRLGVTSTTMQRWLSLSKQTYARRRKQGRLSVAESDRVVRYAELLRCAAVFLGDGDAAAHWLNTPAPALGGEAPLDHATTEIGARNVLRLIGRLEHGIPT